jgi:subtilase family serine protease
VVLLERVASAVPPPNNTNIKRDLTAYDTRFGLPPTHLSIVTSLASPAAAPQADPEEVMDAEMVHVVAPGASIVIVLVRTPANAISPLDEALQLGIAHGAVVSLSGAWGEHCFSASEASELHTVLVAAERHHVTVVASSGDLGAASEPCPGGTFTPSNEVNLPASDPLVLAAGGTSLMANRQSGKYLGEVAWDAGVGSGSVHLQREEASSGGFSHLYARPSYQDGVAGIGAMRGVPDVAADSGTTNLAVVVSYGGHIATQAAGGTSASAPLWAGIIALADQEANRHLGFVNAGIYDIGRSASYHSAFHDVTSGSNTVTYPPQTIVGYQASPGWDPVTGWGSPNAQVLVPLLAHFVSH